MSWSGPSAGDLSGVVRLAAVAAVLSPIELLIRRGALGPGGLLDWEVTGLLPGSLATRPGLVARAISRMLAGPTTAGLLVTQVMLCAGILIWPTTWACVFATAAVHVLMAKRNRLSGDGSDDMVVLVLCATGVALAVGSQPARTACAVFLAGELALSYFTAGISKAQSDAWWQGRALPGVLTTRIFGHPAAAAALVRHRFAARQLTRAAFLLEALFPAAILAPRSVLVAALSAALVFHLACAVLMGLNTFVWAYAACYPGAWWTNRLAAEHLTHSVRVSACLFVFSATVAGLVVLGTHHRSPQDDSLRTGTRSPARS
jgi:hypothetical protein